MANIKISELNALAERPAANDLFVVVDVSEPLDANKTKKIRFDGLNKVPTCRVYNSANISIPNNENTLLTFNSERWDTDAMHSTTTNASRLTCKTAGVYTITGHVRWPANTTGNRTLEIVRNGSSIIARVNQDGMTTSLSMAISTQYALVVNDYVELRVTQTSGAALDILASSAFSPEFGMTWLGTV